MKATDQDIRWSLVSMALAALSDTFVFFLCLNGDLQRLLSVPRKES